MLLFFAALKLHKRSNYKFHRTDVRAIVGKEGRRATVRKKNPGKEKNELRDGERERKKEREKE